MANFQIDKQQIEEIRSLIEAQHNKKLQRKLNQFHYADIAEIIQDVTNQ